MKTSDLKEYIASRLWVWPALGLVMTFGTAILTLYADAELSEEFRLVFDRLNVITGDADAARTILSAIATAMVSLLVFTFTMTMVVIQLASAQYSPRLMRSVLRDKPTHISLTLFICTFAYALIVLRSVVSLDDRVVVPELSLAFTYVLVLTSLFTFIIYINHVAQTMRVGTVIERVTNETLGLIERMSTRIRSLDSTPNRPSLDHLRDGREILCRENGAVSHVDEHALVALAIERDLVIELLHPVGDHVPAGAPAARTYGGEIDDLEILKHITFARSRTMQQDVAYGIRQIVDVANRALSPGINDPTTAVQCIDGLHDLLRRLVDQPDLPTVLTDDDGHPRLVVPRTRWPTYLALATTEIRVYGAGSPQIPRRLHAMLQDLWSAAPPERKAALERELRLLEASVEQEVDLPDDRTLSKQPDYRGLGVPIHPH